MSRILFSIFTMITTVHLSAFGQQVEKSEFGHFALTNATIETVTKGVIESGTVVIDSGRITAVGRDVDIPSSARKIDCSGKSIFPGLIDGGTQIGLFEIASIPLTRDANEVGDFTPHMKALTAVNPNSTHIPITRTNGVTTALTVPQGGLFPGMAALVHLHGYTPNQMFAGYEGMVLNYPTSGRRHRWDRRSEEDIKKDWEKNFKKLNDIWEEATLYAKIDRAGGTNKLEYNPQFAALAEVVKGNMPLLLEVGKKEDILSALKWIEDHSVERVVLTGVAEGWRIADSIAVAEVPVITGPVLALPSRDSDPYQSPYANAGKMAMAGVQVAIRTNESENPRNLPYHAGFAANYGMGKSKALEAVTIVPARIFSLDDELGSIEVGKMANIVVVDGDIFETKTRIEYLFIHGWKVPVESRQTLLYDEFLERQP